MPRREPQSQWVASGIILLATLIALWGLHPLMALPTWFVAAGVVVLVVLAAAAVTRAATALPWMPTVVAVVAGISTITAAYGQFTGLLLIIPTPETVERLRALTDEGIASIREQSTPAEAVPGITFLITILAVVCAIVVDAVVLGLRRPLVAALPLLAISSPTVIIRDGSFDAQVWIGIVICLFVLMRLGRRAVPRATTIGAAVVVIVGSLLIPLALPPVTAPATSLGGGLGIRVNPFIDLGQDLRERTPVTAVEYESDSDVPVYLRLATLENFSGRQWAPNAVDPGAGNGIDDISAALGLERDVARTEHTADIQVAQIGGRWLPVPYPVTKLDGLDGDWSFEPSGLTVRTPRGSVDGQTFTATFDTLEPSREQLAAAGNSIPAGFDRYLTVPTDLPEVQAAATAVAGAGATQYDRAVLLQEWFRSGFVYSENTPAEEGYDGSSLNVLTDFIEKKSGYCVHFSSAMAVMARMLGIPSRIAVGFQPGSRVGSAGEGRSDFEVTTRDLHAWPELYFEGVGWTRFEPTPSRGDVPAYSEPAPVDNPATPDVDESLATPTPEPVVTPSAAPVAPDAADRGSASAAGPRIGTGPLIAIGVLLGLLLLALVPFAVRRVLRAVNLSRSQKRVGGAAAAWNEVRDTARDHGWRAPPTETVRDFADRLELVLMDTSDPIVRLRDAIEEDAYSQFRGALVRQDDLRAVLQSISRSVNRRERLRAALWPPSLVERWLPGSSQDPVTAQDPVTSGR